MQCPYCGNRLRSDDLFCPACGRRVGQSGAKHGKKKKRGKKGFSPAKWVLPLLLALLVVAAAFFLGKKLTEERRGSGGAKSPAAAEDARSAEDAAAPQISENADGAAFSSGSAGTSDAAAPEGTAAVPAAQTGDSAPESGSAPAEDASPVPGAATAPQPSGSPSAPGDAAAAYEGLWVRDGAGNCSIKVSARGDGTVALFITTGKLAPDGVNISAVDYTTIEGVELSDGQGQKEYADGRGNRGVAYLSFSGNALRVRYEDTALEPGANWGVSIGSGSYHRDGVPPEDGKYYVRILSVDRTATGCTAHVTILKYDVFREEDAAALYPGAQFYANGRVCTVAAVDMEAGWITLEDSTCLRRNMNGSWIVTWPSDVPVYYDYGTFDFSISDEIPVKVDSILLASYGEELNNYPLWKLYGAQSGLSQLRYLFTIENGVVTAVELPYSP